MKVGDLVRPAYSSTWAPCQTGIIIGWEGAEPIVFWSERFPDELEYKEQIEVISENR
jgi:hypothetical protein